MTINVQKQNIRRKDFFIFAETIGIPPKSAEKMISKIAGLKDKYITMCAGSYLPESMKYALTTLIEQRIAILKRF